MAMIVSEFILLEIEGEVLFGDAVAFQVVLLGKAPESFDAVDMGAAFHISDLMSNDAMFSIRMQVIVALPFIAVKDRTFDRERSNPIHEGLLGDVRHDDAVNPPRTLQKPENNDFAGGAASAPALAPAAEIGFVDLNLSKEFLLFLLRHFQDRRPESAKAAISSVVGHAHATRRMMRARGQAKCLQQLPLDLSVSVRPFAPAIGTLLLLREALMSSHMALPAQLAKQMLFMLIYSHRLTLR